MKNKTMEAYCNQGYKQNVLTKKPHFDSSSQKKEKESVQNISVSTDETIQSIKNEEIPSAQQETNDEEAEAQTLFSEEQWKEIQKKKLVKQLMRMETDFEQLKYKMNNDVSYINHLHEYNYLKVSR